MLRHGVDLALSTDSVRSAVLVNPVHMLRHGVDLALSTDSVRSAVLGTDHFVTKHAYSNYELWV